MQIPTKCGLNRTVQYGSRFNIQQHGDHSFLAYKNQDMCEPNFEYTHTHTPLLKWRYKTLPKKKKQRYKQTNQTKKAHASFLMASDVEQI